jgi:cation:H+ antiporter
VSGLSTWALVAVFAIAGVATWVAGIYLSRSTDALDVRLNLGEALGGMILLAIAGSLPELAITISAVLNHNLGMAAGNLIGGIAVQTLVLVILDASIKEDHPLSFLVGSLVPVLEGLLVILLCALVMMGALLPETAAIAGVSPASMLIVAFWLIGIAVLNRFRKDPPWEVTAPGAKPGRRHRRHPHPTVPHPYAGSSTALVVIVFAAGSIVTLLAGWALQVSGGVLAERFGMTGLLFGATVLAVVSSLPEVSTGLTAVKLGDHQLAMGDIFGGNAFQVCLFLVADLLAGKPVLPSAGAQNSWLAAAGFLVTAVYATSVIVRPKRLYLRVGLDSIAVVVIYAVAIVGLARVSG